MAVAVDMRVILDHLSIWSLWSFVYFKVLWEVKLVLFNLHCASSENVCFLSDHVFLSPGS